MHVHKKWKNNFAPILCIGTRTELGRLVEDEIKIVSKLNMLVCMKDDMDPNQNGSRLKIWKLRKVIYFKINTNYMQKLHYMRKQ